MPVPSSAWQSKQLPLALFWKSSAPFRALAASCGWRPSCSTYSATSAIWHRRGSGPDRIGGVHRCTELRIIGQHADLQSARVVVARADAVAHRPFDVGGVFDDAAGDEIVARELPGAESVRSGAFAPGAPLRILAVAGLAMRRVDHLAELHRDPVQAQRFGNVIWSGPKPIRGGGRDIRHLFRRAGVIEVRPGAIRMSPRRAPASVLAVWVSITWLQETIPRRRKPPARCETWNCVSLARP